MPTDSWSGVVFGAAVVFSTSVVLIFVVNLDCRIWPFLPSVNDELDELMCEHEEDDRDEEKELELDVQLDILVLHDFEDDDDKIWLEWMEVWKV